MIYANKFSYDAIGISLQILILLICVEFKIRLILRDGDTVFNLDNIGILNNLI